MSRTPIGKVFDDPAGLGSMLSRRPDPRRGPGQDDPRQSSGEEGLPPPKADPGRRTASPKPKPSTSRRLPDTIVYVTPTQASHVRAERRLTGRTITEIVLSAVERAAPSLRSAFREGPRTREGAHLFYGSSRPQSKVEDELGKVQLCLRMIKSDRTALDTLVVECNAPSRSHLVRKALEVASSTADDIG
jgi:hypothetical protein